MPQIQIKFKIQIGTMFIHERMKHCRNSKVGSSLP